MAKKILIVDDDPDIRLSTESILRKRYYEVLGAENGLLALQLLKKVQPDLILLDVLMPVMDGYSFYKEIKSQKSTEGIPVLVVTGRGKMEESFKVVGVDGFISKPFSPENLVSEIEHILLAAANRQDLALGPSTTERKSVLIATSDRLLGEGMRQEIIRAGFAGEWSPGAREAIAAMLKSPPDIMFVDLFIPDMRLVEFLGILRKLPNMGTKILVGFYNFRLEDLVTEATRKKFLQVEELSKSFLHSGGDEFMGQYQHQEFLKMLVEKLRPNRPQRWSVD